MAAQMGIEVDGFDPLRGLTMRLPLAPNLNHQKTAFAGSLNALCTMTGWGTMFLLAKEYGLPGDIVIRRSTVKYLKPVVTDPVLATCTPAAREHLDHFLDMLRDKGQGKLDLNVEIANGTQPAVAFWGSYVILGG